MHEFAVEDDTLELLAGLGYSAARGVDLSEAGDRTQQTDWLLRPRLVAAIGRLNPQLSADDVEGVVRVVAAPPHPTLVENNRWLHGLLTGGVDVEYADPTTGERRGDKAQLIDFDNPAANDWLVVRQLTIAGAGGKSVRPDLVVYLNGLPIGVVELKDPTDTVATLDRAIDDRLRKYQRLVPDLYAANLLCVASDGLLTRVGSLTANASRYMPWRPEAGGEPSLDAMCRELLAPDRLLDYLTSCVTFEEDERGDIVKKIAGYHQFRAVRKARERVLTAQRTPGAPVDDNPLGQADGRGGVVWHTQGSGKSLSMLMLAGALVRQPEMANPTVVIVTDRNDLDDQLFSTFAMGRDLLRQAPIQAESREHLAELLDRASGGVIFTTVHKFTERKDPISERPNIVVMADEAHRSQYGFVEGGARWMRDALPNATFVGFTGTPLERDDKNTIHVFGEYADVYDIRQAVLDGATKPLYYESRLVKLKIDDAEADAAEKLVDDLAEADASGAEPAGTVRVRLEQLVGAPDRIKDVAKFVVEHWEARRSAMEGKAMLVTMSRMIAARLYEAIRELRPEWHSDDDKLGAMKVIVTGMASDEAPLAQHGRTKAARKALAARFKDPADEFRLAIVCDMWLTGFDCPPAHTMYLDKTLAGHNLMQAIARVNRVFGDKPGGLIVDMLGLVDQLADALETYTREGGTGDAVQKVQDRAVPVMKDAFETLQKFLHGSRYEEALNPGSQFLPIALRVIDHIFGADDGWKRYQRELKKLSTAYALVVPREEAEAIVDHLRFFQQVAAMIRKRLGDDRGGDRSKQRDIDAAVRQVVGGAVDADEVIDLFAVAGLEDARLDILSDDFLKRISALEQKNLALETLKKLLADEIRTTERTNLVRSRQFREALEDAITKYTNRAIDTAEMIAKLIDLAVTIRDAKAEGQDLGLSSEEVAFYDALAENGSAREAMKSDDLRFMARELTEMVKKMPKLDWTEREAVRATLRRNVRRLLAKYGYPPDLSEDATQLVLRQAELSTEGT
ncbi:type I restriction endonuclease subunit R [Botrimarina mediterranea]|uniref:Type I restriction enzyme endonuclease subunit n=1 Tax=Botrimarina mediterranea TaxID=2528022 RepID=A0A518KC58_9BACT|nr:type I restriction endonuclease subunit R [Botrimarina mediterranea]QDV75382.1 Type-1 restriction enzyme R protein [Botrimarina mediterranea]